MRNPYEIMMCCEQMNRALDPSSELIILIYQYSDDKLVAYLRDGQNMFSDMPISFCPFCGTPIQPLQERS